MSLPTGLTSDLVHARWASAAAGKVVISMSSRPEMIDPEQIGITANAGLIANVFDNETDARAWLTNVSVPSQV